MHGRGGSQKPFGFIGISAVLSESKVLNIQESQKPFGFIGISALRRFLAELRSGECTVTKAFRLHWHFCHKIRRKSWIYPLMSQKPFGFIGISARLRYSKFSRAAFRRSQKPFGFIGISAICGVFASAKWECKSQKPFGFIGISAYGI